MPIPDSVPAPYYFVAAREARITPPCPSSERLLVFAKFPEPGKVKTRLAPTLGDERACRLHAALLRRTLQAAGETQTLRSTAVEVWFSGGEEAARIGLLEGRSFACRSQEGAGLGERLQHAVASAVRAGASRIVVVGADCPDLDPRTLDEAFEALNRFDVVLGPALDGGYYLIGLRTERPELFQGVDWGSDAVLRQTLQKCRATGCSTHLLGPLSDVDRAEDLLACRRIGGEFLQVLPQATPGTISVVIPTLNEEQNLEATLRPLVGRPGVEVVVVDGGSSDRTLEIARRQPVVVVHGTRGRGRQLNAGAAMASGELLLFLHADTRLPTDFAELARTTLANGAVAGAFRLRIDDQRPGMRWIEWGANWRSRRLQLPYGDQALFLSAERFQQMGGFPNWPLMEDYEFVRRLRRRGPIGLAPASVVTSARRWRSLGLVRTTFVNQLCVVGFRLGIAPERLARWYRRTR